MKTIEAESRHEVVISKSRFLAVANRVDTPEEAMRILEVCRIRDATHNTWAYRIETQLRFNDDGEPGGTAGRPILAAIDRLSLDHVLVVVTRWFGGIKLGAAGLARAYGGAAAQSLMNARIHEIRTFHSCRLSVPFPESSRIYLLLEQTGLRRDSERFTDAGIEFLLEVPEEMLESFENALRNTSRGRVSLERLGSYRK